MNFRTTFKAIGEPFRQIKWYIRWEVLPKEIRLRKMYKKFMGVEPNFKNPQKFSEKLQCIKMNVQNPLMTQCADKYRARDFVRERIGQQYLIPLLFESNNPKDVVEENFPNTPFIIKTNHDSSGGVMVKDKKDVDWKKLQARLKKLMKYNYYFASGEWQYKNIKPHILAEELLIAEDGQVPKDVKIHCFNGIPQLVGIDIDRFGNHRRNMYYPNGERADVEWYMPQGEKEWKPKNWDLMMELAGKLSQDFSYARIDFYECNDKIYFGEITFDPSGGFVQLKPKEWDYKLGEMLVLPN